MAGIVNVEAGRSKEQLTTEGRLVAALNEYKEWLSTLGHGCVVEDRRVGEHTVVAVREVMEQNAFFSFIVPEVLVSKPRYPGLIETGFILPDGSLVTGDVGMDMVPLGWGYHKVIGIGETSLVAVGPGQNDEMVTRTAGGLEKAMRLHKEYVAWRKAEAEEKRKAAK